jgi:hypothetical protein
LLAAGNNPIDPPIVRGATGLRRSKTTLNVPIDARERIAGLQTGGQPRSPEGSPPRNAGVGRASSTRDRSPGTGMAGPVRGLSVRKVSATEERRPPVPDKGEFFLLPMNIYRIISDNFCVDSNAGARLTQIYDDYIDSYGDEPPPIPSLPSPSSGSKSDKISAWARANANPIQVSPAVQRSASRSAPSSTYAPSNYGGGSIKRRLTRRNTRRVTAAPSMYNENEEEEEGYGSGEYDDGPFELVKIRVKVCRLPFCFPFNRR